MAEVVRACGLDSKSLVIGAGAGSSHFVGVNCELMPNFADKVNKTKLARISETVSSINAVSKRGLSVRYRDLRVIIGFKL